MERRGGGGGVQSLENLNSDSILEGARKQWGVPYNRGSLTELERQLSDIPSRFVTFSLEL